MSPAPKTEAGPGLKAGIEYGPLVLFFAVNFLAPMGPLTRVLVATGVFMAATVVAMIVSKVKLGRISPMLWLSGILVVVFGGLTLYFHDERFIKMKPTIVYAMFSALLFFGLATGRPLIQMVLGNVYPGLTELGWRKLTRNWACFFAFMAVLNELVWRNSTWDFWVGFKLWGAMPLTLGFAIANIPMLLKHGLNADAAKVDEPPVE
ncbi:septation protein A [Sphingomonas sanguinis]|uniref:Inner membrane-spanning protein YciB n=1 Tax=Sphingomonas sanguinis TaxID=33051 RepID=A0A7Y7UNR1_9SPHN|nr:septation protein A [Sphingomonas sanguinis]MBZ6380161.1 septation protein A [Sphingomonas sanguinis]NNG48790.1 septation protein A [Sphingomonas sanguinis]NNG52037.1 septation protein A [Sphingomonas sanguinis]NVP29462.1 septation protein A [Sphingomonas sanguinis]